MGTKDGSDICNPELRLKTQKKIQSPGQSCKAIFYYPLHSAANMRGAKNAFVSKCSLRLAAPATIRTGILSENRASPPRAIQNTITQDGLVECSKSTKNHIQ